jgi:hypothetical protein
MARRIDDPPRQRYVWPGQRLQKIYETIETWRNRPIGGEHPYVYLDGIVMKRSWAGEVPNNGSSPLINSSQPPS